MEEPAPKPARRRRAAPSVAAAGAGVAAAASGGAVADALEWLVVGVPVLALVVVSAVRFARR